MRKTPGHSLTQNAGDHRVFWLRCSCYTARAWSSFVPLLQDVSSICKPRDQLLVIEARKIIVDLLDFQQPIIAAVNRSATSLGATLQAFVENARPGSRGAKGRYGAW